MSHLKASGDSPAYTIRRANWRGDRTALRAVRRAVFVREQRIAEELEWDGLDGEAVHLLAEAADGEAIATARLLPSGQIGRMAVLQPWRRHGVGRAMLLQLARVASGEAYPPPFVEAQIGVVGFYRKLGFIPAGPTFETAGIPHLRMELRELGRAQAADIQSRTLGDSPGLLRIDTPGLAPLAVATMAGQARREISLLTPDLEPWLYDQQAFLDAVRRLGIARAGHAPIRILLLEPDAALQGNLRLIELARRLTSSIQIALVPPELAEQCDAYLLADITGYYLRRRTAPNLSLVDFADPRRARALRREFDGIWAQGEPAAELRRLHI